MDITLDLAVLLISAPLRDQLNNELDQLQSGVRIVTRLSHPEVFPDYELDKVSSSQG